MSETARNGKGARKPLAATPATGSPGVPAPTLVVGIGASAGGLDAFRRFFSAMPTDSGMAFVLVQHLDPDHASALVSILRNSTTMAVSEAEDGDAIEPNHVFVIPPNAVMEIEGARLKVTRPASADARRASVNALLVSLAQDQGEAAVGIVLAGFGSDGALGVEAIKEHGGLTLTQAEFDHAPKIGMPKSAASSGFVDHVLPVEKMPAALIDHWHYRLRAARSMGKDGLRTDVADHLGAICAVLHSRLGRDFSQYKTNTLMRRVQRRMQVLRTEDVAAYVELLRARPDEPEALFRELLIRVTRFFRDPAAFEALAAHIPAMLDFGGAREAVRAWVPGCACGEEAYSVAILLKEAMARADHPRKVQIFATDVDAHAVDIGRAGIYPGSIATDVPPALLERYFLKQGERYRVAKDLREMCLFSVHDLVKDPPFSRLDLISCRNLMIYFTPALQKRVVGRFHYGLRRGGLLFLGASEAVTAHAALFSPLEKKHRLFARRDAPAQLLEIAREGAAGPSRPNSATEAIDVAVDPRIARVMARYSPAFVVVDRRHMVQQLSGPIGKYLAPTTGAVSMNLSVLVHGDLRAPLRAALREVAATGRRVVCEGLVADIGGRREAVTLAVESLDPAEGAAGPIIVAFQDLGAIPSPAPHVPGAADDESEPLAELVAARERLQTLTEELETSNEELQSTNEEYQSVNEELQSTNEELETSKEELQSMNEELTTLNVELNSRNDELVGLNSDLVNLIDSTSIATLFLDRELRIRRFTPTLLEIFNIRDGDEGRPITDIVSRLARDSLKDDAEKVLRTLAPLQRQARLESTDRTYQIQIRPYRGTNNVIDGVVVTFVDVTEREHAELDRAYLAAIVRSSGDAIIAHDLAGVITSWNAGAKQLFGYDADEAIGQPMRMLDSPEGPDQGDTTLAWGAPGENAARYETVRRRKDGSLADVFESVSPLRTADGAVIGAARIIQDETARRQADREKTLILDELDHRVRNILATVSAIVTQTVHTEASPQSFAASIEGRVMALARAHGLLTQDGDGRGALEALVSTELAPYADARGRVTIGGPDVDLTPKAGMALAMAIHELATNAAKHGALSTESGRLSVTWEKAGPSEAPIVRISWRERDGPPVEPPTRRGFGASLIERALGYELDAVVTRTFDPAGMSCQIDLPLTDEMARLGEPRVEPESDR